MEFKSYGIEAINSDPALEYLDEARIYTGDKIGIGVFPTETRNFIQDPYIKVYNAYDFRKATKLVRIGIFNIRFIRHQDSKQYWELNMKQLRYINKIMALPKNLEINNDTYWIYTLKVIGKGCAHNELYLEKYFDKIPDFTEARKR